MRFWTRNSCSVTSRIFTGRENRLTLPFTLPHGLSPLPIRSIYIHGRISAVTGGLIMCVWMQAQSLHCGNMSRGDFSENFGQWINLIVLLVKFAVKCHQDTLKTYAGRERRTFYVGTYSKISDKNIITMWRWIHITKWFHTRKPIKIIIVCKSIALTLLINV